MKAENQNPENSNKQSTSDQNNNPDYKNVETGVNSPDEFGDDYAVKQEEKMIQDDATNQKNNRVGKGPGEGSK